MQSKEKLVVVIVTYNRPLLLDECIKACLNQSYNFSNVLVINNASNDNTAEIINKYENQILNINLESNIGGAGGFYEGVKYFVETNIKFDYLLLIDDDAILDRDFNKNIVCEIEKNNRNDAFSGVVTTNNEIQLVHRSRIETKKFKLKNVLLEEYDKKTFEYDASSFCGLYVSHETIMKIGYPDKDFFIWGDDTDYSLRIRKYNRIINVNNAILNHKTKTEYNSKITWKTLYYYRNRLLILKKHYRIQFYLELFKDLARIIKNIVLYLVKKDKKYYTMVRIYIVSIYEILTNKLGKSQYFYPGMKL